MKRIQLSGGVKPLYLMIPLLLSACHTPPFQSQVNNTLSVSAEKIDPTKSLFPLENYSQSVDKWIPPGPEMHVPVIDATTQQRHFSALKSHYFGMGQDEQSPWNPHHIASILDKDAKSTRDASINKHLGKNSVSWGENFRVHSGDWKQAVRDNANTSIAPVYHPSGRAIAVREALVRILPTADPAYDDPRKAGQGYPFDNLQDSSIRPGTPVYVLADSRDGSWKYVISPSVTGWVHSEDIAGVDQQFVTEWLTLARENLGAFIKEPVSVHENGKYYFTARPGTILPFRNKKSALFLTAIPVRDVDGRAKIRWVNLREVEFTAMPWQMTPNNIATLMKSMKGRPYGWGNYNFYNDCSAEIRSLLMPFGIFLPRNSASQIQAATRVVDLSQEDTNARIRYLTEHGKPFTTLVYIPGHIMLYIGNAVINGQNVPMTYQNIWGLRPAGSNSRSIIGGSVFFPLLATYPEDPELMSLAGKAQFKLGFIE
ncbi:MULTISPECIES: SH3 domain-containing C40 family peptidase [Yersinia]|uniref:SH3 domain-containing C40 family peptidase n=1 Tax=Yersinia TaxID=629 RepID=UPI001CFE8384|nr:MULTISPECIES: SH3 domain-containing C40 family peptidase [Yersinia]MCB5315889.1 SH3 domain-containing protein [Yersinia massiliensis]